MKTRIVFMGSPPFAVPTLQALSKNYPLVGVVTQPDRPAGRGRSMRAPAVKVLAQALEIPIIQPQRVRDQHAMQQIRKWHPDLIVVVAFGQILRPELLDLPTHGCINVHASLLPRWRGAAPIQAAILNGDENTGVTIMRMDPGMDTGPIIFQATTPIQEHDTADTLSKRLSQLGADSLIETLPAYIRGEIEPQSQEDSLATKAPLLKKKDGELDFNHTANQLERQVRAFNPWPGCYTQWHDNTLKVHAASIAPGEAKSEPGKKTIFKNLPAIQTSCGLLVLNQVQPAGKKRMQGEIFLRGAKDWKDS